MTTSVLESERGALPMGCRAPRLLLPARGAVRSDGPDAIELAASAGLILEDWQQDALVEGLGVGADGLSAAMNVGLVVARQNGKGSILEALELFWLFLAGIREVTHTAHEFKTAKKHFLRILGLIRNTPALNRQVYNVLGSNSETSIQLFSEDGPKLTFLARSGSSGRGLQGEKIVLDEGLYLTEEIMAALLPIQAAQRDPQAWIASTPPAADGSPTLTQMRNDAVGDTATEPEDTCWMEWSAPDGSDPNDLAAVAQANPELGRRLPHRNIARETRTLMLSGRKEEVLRERMCLWPVTSASRVLDADRFDALGEYTDPARPQDAPQVTGAYAIGIAATHDLSRIWAYVAGDCDDGAVQVELAREFRSRRGVAAWLEQAYDRDDGLCAIVIDPKNPAAVLMDDIEKLDLDVLRPTGGEYAATCVGIAAIVNGTEGDELELDDGEPLELPALLRHLGDEPLALAARNVGRRPLGSLWAWRAVNAAVDVAPMEAATLAVFGLSRGRPETGGVILV